MRGNHRSQCIELLPAAVVATLGAPQVIHSLAQALEELVSNSIDAQSTHIECEVDVVSLSLCVVDNGCGIAEDSFESVAQRHCTSKLRNQHQLNSGVATLGFKGEALACIAEVSLLQLTSKAAGSFETHMKLLKGGRLLKHGLALEQRQKAGTVVLVKDLLFNQPVRRRHYVQSSMSKELDLCRETLLRLALAHPSVAFMLTSKGPRRRLLHLAKGRSVTDVLPLLFGDQQHSLQEVAHSVAALSIQGYIAVPPATFGHKHKQYLYINNRYVRAGQIGKLINSLFRSVMLKLEQADEHQRKASQQYPAFALQIACPASSYDITSDPDKAHIEFADWPAVLSAVQAAVLDAWHTVVGDKMLSELLDNPFCAARAHSQLPVAADGTAPPALDMRHLCQSSAQAVTRPESAEHRRKHQPHSPQCVANQDDLDLTSLFSHAPASQPNQNLPAYPQTYGYHGAKHGSSESSPHDSSNRDKVPSTDPSVLSQQAAPRVLLARLQSSVKLRFAEAHPEAPCRASQDCQVEHLSAHPQSSDANPDACLVPSACAQDVLWPSVSDQPNGRSHRSQSPFAGDTPLPTVPSTTIDHCVPCPPFQADQYAREAKRGRLGTAQRSKAGCNKEQRAASAPPHYRSRRRSAHTNPLYSLHTDWPAAPVPASVHTGFTHDAPDALQSTSGSTAGQSPHAWMHDAQIRQRHTISGVCGQLRQEVQSTPANTLLSDMFRRKRSSKAVELAQEPSQAPFCSTLSASAESSHNQGSAATDAAAAHQLPKKVPATQGDHGHTRFPVRKRVRFDSVVNKDHVQIAEQHTSLPAPAELPPSTPSLHPAEPQQHSSVTLSTAASSKPASTAPPISSAQQAAQLGLPNDAQLHQQTSLATPSLAELLQSWSNPSMPPSSARSIVDLPSLCCGAVHSVMPTTITRANFQQGIALCQMENKFIALVCNGVLSVVDQHAADERVRLEKLRAAVLGSQGHVSSVAVAPPVCMSLSSREVQMLEMYKLSLERWGWRWRSSGPDTTSVPLTHFGCVLGATMNAVDLQVYLHQLAETNGSSVLPPAVIRTLNGKACRSAIMFGDPLLPSECTELISSLKATQLCFSCAHGRPTMAPLVNVQALHDQLSIRGSASFASRTSSNDAVGLQDRLLRLLSK